MSGFKKVRAAAQATAIPLVYDARVNKSTAPWHFGRETNAYTSVVQLDSTRLMVIYDQNTLCSIGANHDHNHSLEEDFGGNFGGNSKPCFTSHSYSMVVTVV